MPCCSWGDAALSSHPFLRATAEQQHARSLVPFNVPALMWNCRRRRRSCERGRKAQATAVQAKAELRVSASPLYIVKMFFWAS